jgi:hypothetical protein
MCCVGDLVATPWHPVKIVESEHDTSKWVFPVDVAEQTRGYSGYIYSVLLQPDSDVNAHAIQIGGVWGVTLGHGILRGGDARAHQFLGDYTAVLQALMMLGPGRHGVYRGAGVKRDVANGMVCGFQRLRSVHTKYVAKMGHIGLSDSEQFKLCF